MTTQHPVYSLDRGDFVAAGELSAGERLATLAGPTAVLGIQPQNTAGQHKPQTSMTNPNQLTQQELQAWDRCKQVGEDFMRLSQADQLILTKMIERQLTQGSAHFREQSEAWLADVLGEQAAALMVDKPRG